MKNQNIKDLEKKLKIEELCTIVALLGTAVTFVASIITFFVDKDTTELTTAMNALMATIVLGILKFIFGDVKKYKTPFAQPIVTKLEVMAVVTMVAAVLPDMVTGFAEVVAGREWVFDVIFGSKTVFILWLGVIIGILSAVFEYGVKLQEDMDSIA